MCTVCTSMRQTKSIEELCLFRWLAWLHHRTIWVCAESACYKSSSSCSLRAHFILVKDAAWVPYSNRTAGASSTWQSRSQSLRPTTAAVALIHCLSGETGPVGGIEGLSRVLPSHQQGSVFGGLNWKRENDVWVRYSVVKHNDPALQHFSTTYSFLSHFVVFMILNFPPFSATLPLSRLDHFLWWCSALMWFGLYPHLVPW